MRLRSDLDDPTNTGEHEMMHLEEIIGLAGEVLDALLCIAAIVALAALPVALLLNHI